jgi:hypothetical protein
MVFKQAGSGLVGERCATVTIYRGRWREGGRKEGRKEGRGKMRESELRLGGKKWNEWKGGRVQVRASAIRIRGIVRSHSIATYISINHTVKSLRRI